MFESDEWLLIQEIVNLPRSCAERKVNEVVKRIRIIKVHVCILSYLRKKTPRLVGRRRVQRELIDNLQLIFETVRKQNNLSEGDFPSVEEFANCLREMDDFTKFVKADKETLRLLDELILVDIPNIMKGTTGISDPILSADISENKS